MEVNSSWETKEGGLWSFDEFCGDHFFEFSGDMDFGVGARPHGGETGSLGVGINTTRDDRDKDDDLGHSALASNRSCAY